MWRFRHACVLNRERDLKNDTQGSRKKRRQQTAGVFYFEQHPDSGFCDLLCWFFA
jgi:hypothetical protein